MIFVLVQQKGLLIALKIISNNRVSTCGSCFKYKPDRHRTCLAIPIHFVIPLWYCSQGNRSQLHFAIVHLRGLRTYQVFALYFYCHSRCSRLSLIPSHGHHMLSVSLFDLSICFIFLLFIIFGFQHFLLLFTFPEVK